MTAKNINWTMTAKMTFLERKNFFKEKFVKTQINTVKFIYRYMYTMIHLDMPDERGKQFSYITVQLYVRALTLTTVRDGMICVAWHGMWMACYMWLFQMCHTTPDLEG